MGFVLAERIECCPVITSSEVPRELAALSVRDIERMSAEALQWASQQRVEDRLARYRNLPTSSEGERPIRHLASLAIAGDAETLERYRTSFEGGDRMGFVPYIELPMILQALDLAATFQTRRALH